MKCHYCPTTSDLRPYGPRGSMVCFSCAMASPERRRETEKNFGVQLDACGEFAVAGGELGPYPLEHAAPDVKAALAAMSSPAPAGDVKGEER